MIDPKKIAEWKMFLDTEASLAGADLEHDGECDHGMWWEDCPNTPCAEKAWEVRRALAEAVPALLAEREEMLSVLREVEWARGEGNYCPVCVGANPSRDWEAMWARIEIEAALLPPDLRDREYEAIAKGRPKHHVGHRPDCRLSALLKGDA